MNEEPLIRKLEERKNQRAFRQLGTSALQIDFCSNDYLGLVSQRLLPETSGGLPVGSTGSRLLRGNYPLIEETESVIARFHSAFCGVIFNSGYDANIGLLSCIPQKADVIIYDQLCHASLRDGIRLSFARSFAFEHNNMTDLEKKMATTNHNNIFIVTESVFSMDGDLAHLEKINELCIRHNANLIVDEAHATGVIGEKGEGLVQRLGLENNCFARVHTFGKALGCHGAIVLGSLTLKEFLINFSRPFIYTTALPPTVIDAVGEAYRIFPGMHLQRAHLTALIRHFQTADLPFEKKNSATPIQAVIVPGNERVKKIASLLQHQQLDVRPILYPTVPAGSERLRVVLHAYNTFDQLDLLIKCLQNAGG